jgi:hypothetical protein
MGVPEGNVFLSVDLWATQHIFSLFQREEKETENGEIEKTNYATCTLI